MGDSSRRRGRWAWFSSFAKNDDREFEYASSMVGASVSSNDPAKGHQDQAGEDIERGGVGAMLETSLVEIRGEILVQIADYLASFGLYRVLLRSEGCHGPSRAIDEIDLNIDNVPIFDVRMDFHSNIHDGEGQRHGSRDCWKARDSLRFE
jgi:hypothetical protein